MFKNRVTPNIDIAQLMIDGKIDLNTQRCQMITATCAKATVKFVETTTYKDSIKKSTSL